jgi:hypothetical protein
MQDYHRPDLIPVVERAEAEILRIVRTIVPNADLIRIGPYDFGAVTHGAYWSCAIKTNTDGERDRIVRLAQEDEFFLRLRNAAIDAGFAPRSFGVESQETVNRDYKGSWGLAMK